MQKTSEQIMQELIDEHGRPEYLHLLCRASFSLPENAVIVEIGCQNGGSTVALGLGRKQRGSGHVYTIDPVFLTGEVTYPDEHNGMVTTNSSLEKVQNKFREAGLESIVTVIPGFSYDVVETWNTPIDLLFFDGEHTYDGVVKDCQFMDFIKPGGLAIFDDWIEGVAQAVVEYIDEHREWSRPPDDWIPRTRLPGPFNVISLSSRLPPNCYGGLVGLQKEEF